jgi:hypothetical protein
LELTEQVAVAVLLAVVQGVELRGNVVGLSPALRKTVGQLREHSPFLSADRALEQELRLCLELTRKQHWALYGSSSPQAKALDRERAVERVSVLEAENKELHKKDRQLDKINKVINRPELEKKKVIVDLIADGVSVLDEDEKKRKEKQAVNALFAKLPNDKQAQLKKIIAEPQNEPENEDDGERK